MEHTAVLDRRGLAASTCGRVLPLSRLRPPAPLTLWILFCMFCNCAGWILSAFHQLNALGYAIAFAAGIGAVFVFRKKIFPVDAPEGRWSAAVRFARRFRRPFPLAF